MRGSAEARLGSGYAMMGPLADGRNAQVQQDEGMDVKNEAAVTKKDTGQQCAVTRRLLYAQHPCKAVASEQGHTRPCAPGNATSQVALTLADALGNVDQDMIL